MSSLQDQLAQISTNNATVALDRKKRQKLHSASLIYNPKTASTQDYDFIFVNALDSFRELVEVDPKFEIFSKTLFSETSMSIDRNLQSKEEASNLDGIINAYLMLISSRWHLAPTLHATEWLVRRFQIHISNAETFLLSTINYYQTPIFKRILNLIKLPPLFNSLSGFVRSEANPSNMTIVKLFNDMDFLKLYCSYFSKCIKQKATYTNQLLFTSCCIINLIASNCKNETKLNELVPIILEMSAKLLASSSVDCQISAHCILAVFATALPLKKEIIMAAIETILSNLESEKAKKSALVTICKLTQTLKGQGNVDQWPARIYKLFDSRFNIDEFAKFLIKTDCPACDKFTTSYIRSVARYDQTKLTSVVNLLENSKLEKFEVRLIITDLIHLSEILEDKSQLIALFEYFVSRNEDLVLKCIKALNISRELFEIKLTTSLFTKNEEASENDVMKALSIEKVANRNTQSLSFKDFFEKNSTAIYTSDRSLLSESDKSFVRLLPLFVESVSKNFPTGLFLSSFLTTLEAKITFLLRITVSPAAPVALRLLSITQLFKFINQIDRESNVFTLVPCLVCALSDVSRNVRSGVKKLLLQISKRPFTKHYFMVKRLYGEGKEIPMLNPKDVENWLTGFLNEYIVDNCEIANIVIPKKNEKVYLLFWAQQALAMPLPLPKMIMWRTLKEHPTYSGLHCTIFEDFFSTYLNSRTEWKERCKDNKTDFVKFEKTLAELISPKGAPEFIIDFIINALNSNFESLANIVAERLVTIFASLKSNQQLQILQSTLEAAAEGNQCYDVVGTLQSLALSTETFVSILNKNRIHTDSEVAELSKRRRRRSSTNKAVLQKDEVSQLAEIHLRKLAIILEMLDKSKVAGSTTLLSTLLSLLSDLETLERDGGLPVAYAQETLSSCMLNTINSLEENKGTKLKNVRADVVVSAIRSSSSPQVQNKLLLVVGALASLDLETVLHSVMPIFTFMGAHSIRQDDEFTTHVVENTIKTIVPALLAGSGEDISNETEFLLMSFTTALQHVPKHRRVKLYATLVKAFNASTAIAPFLFLILQQYSTSITSFKISEGRSFVEFTKSFLTNFDILEQLNGWNKFLSFFKTLIDIKKDPEQKSGAKPRALFTNGILNLSRTELLTLIRNGFNFIDRCLEETEVGYYDINGSFKVKLYSSLLDTTNEPIFINNVRSSYGQLLQSILSFINSSNESFSLSNSDEMESSSESDNFHEIDEIDDVKNVLFHLLSHILNVLPVEDFVDSVLPLLTDSVNADIRYHLTLVIGTKFDGEGLEAASTASKVVEVLLERISTEKAHSNIVQVLFNTVGSLVAKFGSYLENALLVKALDFATKELDSPEPELLVSSLTVVTSSIEALGPKCIAFYPKIVPPSIKIFALSQLDDIELKEQLQLSILLLFAAMIKRIPSFLMSDLASVLKITFLANEIEPASRLSVISLIIDNIELKEVLKVLYKLWTSSDEVRESSIAVSLFLSALESTVESIDKKSATSQSPIFFKLLLHLFEYRSISSFDNNALNRIEASVYQISNAYVLKLNDKVFRPLFVILLRWTFDAEGVTNRAITEVERLTSFFKFFNKLQENLKGIITSYFTYLIEPVNKLLQRFISRDIVDVNLRRLTLNSLTSSFKYDRDEYWRSTARFELICESLVNQLSNIEDVVGKYLVKSIASLASNNSRVDEHNRFMHKLLMAHMIATCRSSEKLWTIKTFKLIYSKVGESWLSLLPQLVPIIAELLEDDDEEVEHEVRLGLVRVVENVLGEPFDRYLD
ncbi:hypothetical protein HG535_0H00890 [Zygotorulaspora mrakii]|uniref:U3 small nucleolar RNA-associated protein 10 n=1 Tax=Zygotorulaspora mrakii TaxID=42260 RepID=A0A7H9B8C3_ZYGMR|nr:uncharacterized protein HG535_0H00890 [Zygotorulaspora mrakii]QLG74763.1 hypothetical protein HG535_0H00890 [Zygotorulaspora mrakii]